MGHEAYAYPTGYGRKHSELNVPSYQVEYPTDTQAEPAETQQQDATFEREHFEQAGMKLAQVMQHQNPAFQAELS